MRQVTERDLRMPEFYHANPEDLEFRDDGKLVRKDRWETGVRNIASILGWSRKEYEIPEVVEKVRGMARFSWNCENGCGPCDVKRIEFEYSRTETTDGELLESLTIPRLVSACCGAAVSMWDNYKDEQIDIAVEPMALPDSPSASGTDTPPLAL